MDKRMGVVFKRKFIFFQTPRTASNAMQNALMGIGTREHRPVHYEWLRIGQHMTRPEVNQAFPGHEKLPGVCGIRNPFDIIASWFIRYGKHETIRDLLKNENHKNFRKDDLLYYHVPHCQFLIRYEGNILSQLNAILKRFRCRLLESIPKATVTKDKKPYQEYYTQTDIDAMWEMFGDEITALNYSFEGEPLG